MAEVAELRKAARLILEAAIRAADPAAAIRRHVSRQGDRLLADGWSFDLSRGGRVLVVGGGKAGAPMARAVEEWVGDRGAGGVIVVKYGHGGPTARVRILEAGHPIPDDAGVAGARAVLHLAEEAGEGDLVIALISGGGSALVPLPAPGITLSEKQALTHDLLACGATIREMNTVRKHLSAIKGGQLARAAAPATVLSLILSDIVGDPLDAIASGPTVPDGTTFVDALGILDRYGLREKVAPSIIRHLEAGRRGAIAETPKPEDSLFGRVTSLVVGNNLQALEAAAEAAAGLGFRPWILSSSIEGETREIAKMHAAIAREVIATGHPVAPPCCLISGGETTVTLRGGGKGGRNQEFVLAAALALEGLRGVVVLSAGTDGTDGPTDAAGAVADGDTAARARAAGLDPARSLAENDSYPFFGALGDLVLTGPTGTNVMDVRLLLIGGAC